MFKRPHSPPELPNAQLRSRRSKWRKGTVARSTTRQQHLKVEYALKLRLLGGHVGIDHFDHWLTETAVLPSGFPSASDRAPKRELTSLAQRDQRVVPCPTTGAFLPGGNP